MHEPQQAAVHLTAKGDINEKEFLAFFMRTRVNTWLISMASECDPVVWGVFIRTCRGSYGARFSISYFRMESIGL